MFGKILIPAVLTGVFCAAFAVGLDHATDMLERNQVILFAFTSGFLGYVFAVLVLKRRAKK